MRKVLLSCLLIMIIPVWMSASPDSVDMVVTFNTGSGAVSYTDFGFSSDAGGDRKISSFHLNVSEGGDTEDDIYAYWDVMSASSFILSLYCEPLVSDEGEMLDWTVSWTAGGRMMEIGGGNEYGTENSDPVTIRIAERGGPLLTRGSRKLDISVLSEKTMKAGDYTGNLILRMESL